MNEEIVIQEYIRDYQNDVLDLILDIQQSEYGVKITKEDQPDLLKIEEYYQVGNGNFWVALYNGRVVGTISLLDIGDNRVALRKMFVQKEFRGAKYGTAKLLLQCSLQWTKAKLVQIMYLGTTPQFVAAHRFYEKNGFISIEREELPNAFPVVHVDRKFYKKVL